MRTPTSVRPLNIFSKGGQAGSSIVPLSSPKVWHDGQIIALVVAETLEAAAEAAAKVGVAYDAEPPSATLDSGGATVKAVADADKAHKDPTLGDADRGFRRVARHDRRRIFHPDPAPQSDGAVHHDLRLGRRQARHPRAQPVRLRLEIRGRHATRPRPGRHPRHEPVRRRRVRLQGLADGAHSAGRPRCAPRAPAGEARRHARPGVHHRDLSRGDPASRPSRRRAGTARSRPTCTRRGS